MKQNNNLYVSVRGRVYYFIELNDYIKKEPVSIELPHVLNVGQTSGVSFYWAVLGKNIF